MTKEVGVIWGRKILVELAGPPDQQLLEFEIVQAILQHILEPAPPHHARTERIEALYCRGRSLVLRMDAPARLDNEVILRHREIVPFKFRAEIREKDMATLVEHYFAELFIRANWQCPNCKCVVYNSQNYMEIPDWLRKQEEERGIRGEML